MSWFRKEEPEHPLEQKWSPAHRKAVERQVRRDAKWQKADNERFMRKNK